MRDCCLAEINLIAGTTGEATLPRTACCCGCDWPWPPEISTQRSVDLSWAQGEMVRWQLVSPTLMNHLHVHAEHRHASRVG